MTSQEANKARLVRLVGAVGLLFTLSSCQDTSRPFTVLDDDPFATVAIAPRSIEEVVRSERDLIVIGTVGTSIGSQDIYFSEPGDPGPTDEPENLTDFKVTVESVLWDRQGGVGGSPPTYIQRVATGNPYPAVGVKYLIVATFNEGEPGSTYSSWFQTKDFYLADTTPVQYADGEPVPYAIGLTWDEFVSDLEDEIANQ